jgi:sigma-E factor negative regulatory protein RseB
MDRIADMETMVVHIDPRDQFRYGFKFWINRKNGLMMKSSLIDENQREIEQVMFTSLRLFGENETLVIDSMPTVEDDYHLVRYHQGDDTHPVELDSAWQLDTVPGGFWRDSVLMRQIPDSNLFVRQLVYTDGLASLSVFIERQSSDTIEGSMSMGAVNAYIRILAEHSITAIGEVPAITVRRVAEAVTYHGQ